MRLSLSVLFVLALLGLAPAIRGAEPLPFNHKVDVYREKDGDAVAFSVRLEQPFLAEEFEKSNYLRLHALDRNAYLIYPKETKFVQKHAEFFGRLRGQGKAKLRLSYEIVSENLDGSRKVEVRQGDIEVAIPTEPTGARTIFQEWARQQNTYFRELLNYYPDESFFYYCLLQSRDRYGVTPPEMPPPQARPATEAGLYDALTGSLAIQQSLQTQVLTSGSGGADLDTHISELSAPTLQSLDYAKLLEEKRTKNGSRPAPHELSKLIPDDQYFLHFDSMSSAGELFDLTNSWGDSLLRLLRVHAQDNRLEAKLEDQLCVRRGLLTRLFADGVVAAMAVTGSDPFVLEGTDVTLLFRLKQPELFDQAAALWLSDVKRKHPDIAEREFNYRGHKVAARYTNDRVVTSFVARYADTAIFSNSHGAIRKVIDVATGKSPRLYDALDYQYLTTILPPTDGRQNGYFFASEAFIKRLIGPESKIAEKRRMQCFNNLVMLNNASLFYRLEYGKSPGSLSNLIEGRFVDPAKVLCPHGGAYSYDAKQDTCTCTLHNRIKYLTPNAELPVLKVSRAERQEYERYKERYRAFWQTVFDPLAVRITLGPTVRLEVCVLPFANGSLYNDLRSWVDAKPRPLSTSQLAPSAFASLIAVHGRQNVAGFLRQIPGIPEVLQANPTLTDLSWVGDRASVHFCDGSSILEIDPTRLAALDIPLAGKLSAAQQILPFTVLSAATLPSYVSIEVVDRDKAAQLLKQLSAKIFLQGGKTLGQAQTLDAYRLPDYKKHTPYVLSMQMYAVKVRMHVALVANQLVAATRPEILREVIDAAANPESQKPIEAHLLLRLNRRGLNRLHNDVELYWAEKARLACHRNTISIYNLLKLYEVPIDEVPRLSEAKYGVRFYCPDHGAYSWDTRRDQVQCSVHGNRQESRQNPRLDRQSSFAEFIDSIKEVTASLRFQDEALITTVEIARNKAATK